MDAAETTRVRDEIVHLVCAEDMTDSWPEDEREE
jgi:hypothetical protein